MKESLLRPAWRLCIAILSGLITVMATAPSRADTRQLIVSISAKKPLVIYAHGGSGYRKPDQARVATIRRMGYSTISFDAYEMNGVDWRSASRSFTTDQRQDLIADGMQKALAFARSRSDVDQNNIFLYGHSNGGTVALYFGNTENGIRGVIAKAPSGDGRYAYRGDVRVPTVVFFGKQDNWNGRYEEDFIYSRRLSFASTPTATWIGAQKSNGRPINLIFYDRAGHDFHHGTFRKVGGRGFEAYMGSSPDIIQSYDNAVRAFLTQNSRR